MATHDTTDRDTGTSIRQKTLVGVILLAMFVGAIAGHLLGGDGLVQAAVQSDATPSDLTESEREELNRLRTEVAEAAACVDGTPTANLDAAASPEAVELLQPGTTVTIQSGWTVTVKGISLAAPDNRAIPEGRFVQVEMTVTNNNESNEIFGFSNWVLIDDQGNTYSLDHPATVQVSSSRYYRTLDPGSEHTFSILYDVPVNTGSTFTLVYSEEPTIQYSLMLQMFG